MCRRLNRRGHRRILVLNHADVAFSAAWRGAQVTLVTDRTGEDALAVRASRRPVRRVRVQSGIPGTIVEPVVVAANPSGDILDRVAAPRHPQEVVLAVSSRAVGDTVEQLEQRGFAIAERTRNGRRTVVVARRCNEKKR